MDEDGYGTRTRADEQEGRGNWTLIFVIGMIWEIGARTFTDLHGYLEEKIEWFRIVK
jgi:hypothetical protein